MKRFVFVLVLLVLAVGVTTAQSPAPAAVSVPAAAPALEENELLFLQILNLTEQMAYSDCQRLESMQKFQATLADVTRRIEAKHPGYALDRAKGALVAKAAPAK